MNKAINIINRKKYYENEAMMANEQSKRQELYNWEIFCREIIRYTTGKFALVLTLDTDFHEHYRIQLNTKTVYEIPEILVGTADSIRELHEYCSYKNINYTNAL